MEIKRENFVIAKTIVMAIHCVSATYFSNTVDKESSKEDVAEIIKYVRKFCTQNEIDDLFAFVRDNFPQEKETDYDHKNFN